MTVGIYRLELLPRQPLFLGTGRGAGYSTATAASIPAGTLLGAIAAACERTQGQSKTSQLIAGTSVSDAVASPARPLDQFTCKYPAPVCPQSYTWSQAGQKCPHCGNKPQQSKGEPTGLAKVTSTRVDLDRRGRAEKEKLFARQGLVPDDEGTTLSAYLQGDPEALGLVAGAVLRVGGARSVAGAVLVKAVNPVPAERFRASTLRIVMASRGVFVDDFGFPTDRPTPRMLEIALGHPARVVRSFVRWTTAGGWARIPNRPKPEDLAVMAGSVFHVEASPAESGAPAEVPNLGVNLGIRTLDGCGWFTAGPLESD